MADQFRPGDKVVRASDRGCEYEVTEVLEGGLVTVRATHLLENGRRVGAELDTVYTIPSDRFIRLDAQPTLF